MKPTHRVLIYLFVTAVIGWAVSVGGAEGLVSRTVALSSIFTGFLTLTGFIFTARTFITFKMNDVVYSNVKYREHVEALRKDGAYDMTLYQPLKNLDVTIGRTCLLCFSMLFAVLMYSICPKEWGHVRTPIEGTSLMEIWEKWDSSKQSLITVFPIKFLFYQCFTVLVYSSIVSVIVEGFSSILKVNRNIHSIIEVWEKNYEQDSTKPGGTSSKQ